MQLDKPCKVSYQYAVAEDFPNGCPPIDQV